MSISYYTTQFLSHALIDIIIQHFIDIIAWLLQQSVVGDSQLLNIHLAAFDLKKLTQNALLVYDAMQSYDKTQLSFAF